MEAENKPKLFLCHSSKDNESVEDLARRLTSDSFSVWFDGWEIHVGHSIVQKINEGISSSDFLIIVLSKNSVDSKWVKKELSAAEVKSMKSKGIFILPILLDKCNIPPLLSDKRYANFSEDPESGYRELIEAIDYHWKEAGEDKIKPVAISTTEIVNPSMEMDPKAIESNWLNFLEEGNQIRIQREIRKLREQIKKCFPEIIELDAKSVSKEIQMRFWTALDQVAIQWLTLIRYKHSAFRTDLLDILKYTYQLVAGPDPRMSGDYPKGKQADLWVRIISRVYALGAASLYLGDYEAVRACIEVEPTWSEYWAPLYWARHALTMYARSLDREKRGLVAIAAEYVKKSPWAREDYDSDPDAVLNHLCGFDLLQCLLVVAHNPRPLFGGVMPCYPSFGQYPNHNVKLVLLDIVNKRESY